jgi:hypothetical protein
LNSKRAFLINYLPPFLILLFGIFLLFRELIIQYPVDKLWASNYDTPLIYWTLSWGYHVVFELGNPADERDGRNGHVRQARHILDR